MEGDWFFLPQMPGQVVWVFGSVENQCISDLGVMGRRGGRAAADMLCGVLVQKELVEDWWDRDGSLVGCQGQEYHW